MLYVYHTYIYHHHHFVVIVYLIRPEVFIVTNKANIICEVIFAAAQFRHKKSHCPRKKADPTQHYTCPA